MIIIPKSLNYALHKIVEEVKVFDVIGHDYLSTPGDIALAVIIWGENKEEDEREVIGILHIDNSRKGRLWGHVFEVIVYVLPSGQKENEKRYEEWYRGEEREKYLDTDNVWSLWEHFKRNRNGAEEGDYVMENRIFVGSMYVKFGEEYFNGFTLERNDIHWNDVQTEYWLDGGSSYLDMLLSDYSSTLNTLTP